MVGGGRIRNFVSVLTLIIISTMTQEQKKKLTEQIINIIVAIISAVATTLGLNSCALNL